MDTFVRELKKMFAFKDTTAEGDIVILASADPKMLVYALVTKIETDPGRKRSWWNVTMQVLTVPPSEVVWTLREPQFTGLEIFTFNGIEHFMKALRFDSVPPQTSSPTDGEDAPRTSRNKLRVIK